MKVKRKGITEILRRIWLFSANKIKKALNLYVNNQLNSSLRHVIVTFILSIMYCQSFPRRLHNFLLTLKVKTTLGPNCVISSEGLALHNCLVRNYMLLLSQRVFECQDANLNTFVLRLLSWCFQKIPQHLKKKSLPILIPAPLKVAFFQKVRFVF